jgi:hypothetical protein
MHGDDFPARSQSLRGAPVELLVQDGVGRADVRAVAGGVRRADRYMRSALGRRVKGPVAARIARGDPCPGADGDRSVIGEGGAGEICIDTANVQWQWLIRNHGAAAAAIPAHEYVHVLQEQLGCLPAGDDRDYRWLVEGMASHIGWEALVWSGSVRDADVRRSIRRDGGFDSSLGALRLYETAGGRTPQYARWHLAIRALLAEAARAGLAPRARPESALIRFCRQVGAGRSWRGAFIASFGIPVFDFYSRFEAAVRRSG